MSKKQVPMKFTILLPFHYCWQHRQVLLKALWLPLFFYLVLQLVSSHLPKGMGDSKAIPAIFLLLSLIITVLSFYLQAYTSVYWQRYILRNETVPEAVVPPKLTRAHGKYMIFSVVMDILKQLMFGTIIVKAMGMSPVGLGLMFLLLFIAYSALSVRLQFVGIQASLDRPLRFLDAWRQSHSIWGAYFLSFCGVHFIFYGVLAITVVSIVYFTGAILSFPLLLKYVGLVNIVGFFGHVLLSYLACYYYKQTGGTCL